MHISVCGAMGDANITSPAHPYLAVDMHFMIIYIMIENSVQILTGSGLESQMIEVYTVSSWTKP